MIYSVISLVVRIIIAFILFPKGKRAFSKQTRNLTNSMYIIYCISFASGFYVYLFTLIFLFQLGIRMFTLWRAKRKLGLDPIVFALTLVLFIKGSGMFSLDKLFGMI